jgi:hypothetical protein
VQMRNLAEAEAGVAPVLCFWLGLGTDSSNAVAPVNDLAADAVLLLEGGGRQVLDARFGWDVLAGVRLSCMHLIF